MNPTKAEWETAEFQAVVERLRRLKNGEPFDQAYRTCPGKAIQERKDLERVADAYLAEHPEPNPAGEELAAKYRAESRTTEDGKPDGTRESLEQCARMLDTYAPDCFPANALGQIHFARAMMESTADVIRAYLTATQEPQA